MTSTHSLADLALDLVRRYGLTPGDLVIEVGSGDGAFLRTVRGLGPRVLGIDPDAKSLCRAFRSGVDTVAASFCPATADDVSRRYGLASVVLTRSPLAVDNDLPRFLDSATRCLAGGGVIVVLSGPTNTLVEVKPERPFRNAAGPLSRVA